MAPAARIPFLLPVLALVLVIPAHAGFSDLGAGLTGVGNPAVAWGDYDGDGDLDVVLTGSNAVGRITRIYRNSSGAFADALALPASAAISNGSLAWGDYDSDGDLDLAIAGFTGTTSITSIYQNDAGNFTDIGAGLEGVRDGAVGWADADNDGDLDLAVVGYTGAVAVAHLYRNTAGSFADAGAALTGLQNSALAWGDYDNDGDMDLVIAGGSGTLVTTNLYRNDGGTFTPVPSALLGLRNGSLAWGDFDNDGALDLALSGFTGTQVYTRIFRNSSGSFADIGAALQGVIYGNAAWGDFDNDGNLDIVLGGATGSIGVSAIYRNASGSFININASLPGLLNARFAWGDYDHDGDLDLLVAGATSSTFNSEIARIYRNSSVPPNSVPSPPMGLAVSADSDTVYFRWNPAADAQNTTPLGLGYNLWAGNAPGTANVMAPMAALSNGFRHVAELGNVGQARHWKLSRNAFAGGNVYWGVQAIDQAFAGSAFASGPTYTWVAVDDARLLPGLSLRLLGANPFRTEAHFRYALPQASRVSLSIHDISGRRVCELVEGERPAGDHEAFWASGNTEGHHSAAGVYFARLRAGGASTSIRILKIE